MARSCYTVFVRLLIVVLLNSIAMPCDDCGETDVSPASRMIQADDADHENTDAHLSCCDGCLTCSARSTTPHQLAAVVPIRTYVAMPIAQADGSSGKPLSIWHPPRA